MLKIRLGFGLLLKTFSICMLYCAIFLCVFATVLSDSTKEEIENEFADVRSNAIEFKKYCEENYLIIEVLALCNHAAKGFTFTFGPEGPSDKLLIQKCFSSFNLILYGPNNYVGNATVPWEDKGSSYTFKNLKSGSYELLINPCYQFKNCTNIYYKSNHSLSEVTSNSPPTLPFVKVIDMDSVSSTIIPVGVIILIILVAVAVFFCKRHISALSGSGSGSRLIETVHAEEKGELIENGVFQLQNIEVYILYPHDSETKEKVKLLKDFLQKFYCFNVVLLDDELVDMLIDPQECITRILMYKCSSVGDNCNSNKKIIIVEPRKSYFCEDQNKPVEGVQDEIEENVFREAIAVLGFDWARVLQDYCHLFVIRFDDNYCTQDLKTIVPRVRYNIPEHLIDLCFNLSMHSDSIYCEFQKHFLEKLENHPIKEASILKY